MGVTAPPQAAGAALDSRLLTELRAALAAGASPGAALAAAAGDEAASPLREVARHVRLGRPLADVAGTVATGHPAADLLVRALAIAERSGGAASVAVDQVARALRDAAALERLLRVRTAQARGTAVVLAAVPAAGWLLLVGLDRAVLAFYATVWGAASAAAAVGLAGLGWWWSRRIVTAARRAGEDAEPDASGAAAGESRALLVAAAAALVGGFLLGGVLVGTLAAAVAALVSRRRLQRRAEDRAPAGHAVGGEADAAARSPADDRPPLGGAAEAVELVAVALSAGLPPVAAVELVGRLGPPRARAALAVAARRLAGSWTLEDAFADSGLERLGTVLAAAQRWGAPADGELHRLAADLRDERRAAVEEAAERTQLALVFPTTLLTLPAFVLGVVPPLLWTAFAT
ncbi:MAG TPA: type II secretion system F family protein [Egibacteraceae bacterium]